MSGFGLWVKELAHITAEKMAGTGCVRICNVPGGMIGSGN
jgi:hypothetical protein